jgi:hypothetical protein
MGGGRQFVYPKWVWSPAGGWWANPTHWKRNTFIYGVFAAATVAYVYQYSESKTVCLFVFCLTTDNLMKKLVYIFAV